MNANRFHASDLNMKNRIKKKDSNYWFSTQRGKNNVVPNFTSVFLVGSSVFLVG